ncbi:MAG: DUF2007 domain-containing protein [Clostridia bacterium]|nr:DUF2007 domain-containing protein [Clostridia bacterium]
MIICHVCNAECDDNAELCPICSAALKAKISKAETVDPDILQNPTLLTAFEDIISAEIFKDVLKDGGIRFTSSSDMGEALQVNFGGVLVSEDIYVDEADLEKASELLEEFSNSNVEFEEEFTEDEA